MIRECPEHGFFRGEICHCGESGKYILNMERTERIGRFLSGALRHFPDDLGLAIDQHGWVSIDVLIDVMKTRYPWASAKILEALVDSDKKGRYQIKENCIRARYGHSIEVNLDFPDNYLETLYYGASQEEADIIMETGIKPIRQRYIHLSTSYEKAVEAASFHTDNPVIIKEDAFAAMDSGVKMMIVNDYIVLSEAIPSEFLEIVYTE